ncbi:conserved hypothetical protein [Cellulosimicrobium cellulans]|nr:conserved hypothetical protein [Cellulosimicrobium cellulans]
MTGERGREEVMAWVAAYEEAWRTSDADAVERLFTPEATYLRSPYDDEPLHGHDEIRGFWRVDEDARFTVTAEPVAVDGPDAVVRLEVRYLAPREQEYRDLWVLRFARRPRRALRGVGLLARPLVQRRVTGDVGPQRAAGSAAPARATARSSSSIARAGGVDAAASRTTA